MNSFAGKLPIPVPDAEDEPFWTALRAGALCFQQCGECARFTHPPLERCPYCQSVHRLWTPAPRVGRLYSFTIVHHAAHPAVAGDLPYNVVLVAFDECDGVRLISNVIGARRSLRIGMEVELFLEEGDGGYVLPRFRPRD